MFLCDSCRRSCPCPSCRGSHGPCEACDRLSDCVDCRCHHHRQRFSGVADAPAAEHSADSRAAAAHEALRRLALTRTAWSDLTGKARREIVAAAADVLARSEEWTAWIRKAIPDVARGGLPSDLASRLVFAEVVLEPESAREFVRILSSVLPEPP